VTRNYLRISQQREDGKREIQDNGRIGFTTQCRRKRLICLSAKSFQDTRITLDNFEKKSFKITIPGNMRVRR